MYSSPQRNLHKNTHQTRFVHARQRERERKKEKGKRKEAISLNMLLINPGHVRFAVFLSCGAFIEMCKRRGRRPMVRPAPLPPPREDAQRHQEEELASFSSPETTRTTRNIFGSNATGEEDNNNNVNIQCRFCFGSDDMSEMISPCDCSGSAGYVHARCLRHWQSVSLQNSGNTETRCRVCQATFRNLPRRSRRERFLEWFADGEGSNAPIFQRVERRAFEHVDSNRRRCGLQRV